MTRTVVALAQHHGLPTRLLDWTFNPITAGFFATFGLDASAGKTKNIAVWAITRQRIAAKSHYTEFQVQRAHIGYLRAQEGLFAFHTNPEWHFRKHGKWPNLEADGMVKLCLPYSEVDELRRLMFAERCSEAHLMPGYDSVGRALNEHWIRRSRTP